RESHNGDWIGFVFEDTRDALLCCDVALDFLCSGQSILRTLQRRVSRPECNASRRALARMGTGTYDRLLLTSDIKNSNLMSEFDTTSGRLEMLWKDIVLQLRDLFFRRKAEQDLQDELQFHLEMQRQKYGDSEEDQRQARVKFGSVDRVAEECRDVRGRYAIEILAKDV